VDSAFDICIYKVPPPPNDSCVNAIVLTESAKDNCTSISGTTIEATNTSEIFDFQGYIYPENNEFVWYTFTPDSSGRYTIEIDVEESISAFWQVSTGNSSDTLLLVKSLTFGAEPVDLQKDSAYSFSIYSNSETDLGICLYYLPPPPPNDSCINATVLMESQINNCAYISGTTISATNTSEVYISESDTSSAYQKFVWYFFIPDSSGSYTIEIDVEESISAFWQV
jgi:hypothetical protein